MIEFIAASAIATVISGVIVVLMTGVRDVVQTHTTFNQLSGYLDVATTVLRKDIWEATIASQTVGGVCPSDWLTLTRTNPPTTVTITYCLDTSDPNNVKLRRTVDGGAAWNVAQYVAQGGTTAQVAIPLITMNFRLLRTVNGRPHVRTLNNVTYLMQRP